MATIGHTLVGLSIGGLCPGKTRTRVLQFFWLGLMVLAAHVVDIAEWVLTLHSRAQYKQHFVTHSALSTTGLVVIFWLILAFGARVRSPWPYLCVASGIMSHLILDYLPARVFLVELYGHANQAATLSLRDSIVAEIWLYGLLLVLVALAQAARSPGCSGPAKKLAWLLGGICIVTAVTRVAYLWVPAYGLASTHALLLLRRFLRPGLLWSLVPVIPLFVLLAIEVLSLRYYQQAVKLEDGHDYAKAAALHRKALSLPARSSRVEIYIHLGVCNERLGQFASAEHDFLTAVKLAEAPAWPLMELATFYAHGLVSGTSYYRPQEAQRILESIVQGDYSPREKANASKRLDQYRQQGILK